MKIIVCLDDDNGMLFNNKRQSCDKKVVEYIMLSLQGNLYMNDYSYLLFNDNKHRCCVSEDFLEKMKEEDTCFVETKHLSKYLPLINEITIYRWNRKYPGDFFFDINVEENFEKIYSITYKGHSHKKITKEIWKHV